MTSEAFIRRHGLWTEEQAALAPEVLQQVELNELHLIRLAWADPHGAARAKEVTPDTFRVTMEDGYNINVATSTLDASGGRVFTSFVRGGGMDLDEMTGSPNLVIVPDPGTFRILPWAPGVGWILCDEYFRDGTPFHFSSRHLLRTQIAHLENAGYGHLVGLEVEWYLARLVQERLRPDNTGTPGHRGVPLETAPLEPGYSYHSETNFDIMQPILSELAKACISLGLPLRSVENEFGPGQVEFTFAAEDAMRAADNYVLFRTATRQVCRRHGYFGTFMCCPGLAGHFPSGWHLHQSLIDKETGTNRMMPHAKEQFLSDVGKSFLAGLLEHAIPATIFASPTVNGFRRFKPNSLAPNRVTWGDDHRGALMRVISAPCDQTSRIENRAGEPAANPYLFIASQITAGLDGLDRSLSLQAPDDAPYDSDRPLLPTSMAEGLRALKNDTFFQSAFGKDFCDYYLRLKDAELERFQKYCDDTDIGVSHADVTDWEQQEYYDFF
ncbi:MAG: glutamine synthetase family protein [Pseudomonadota bacterium]|nr:glutamine synthetase family protein [Pseudomonadota bacterium]